MLFIYLAYSKSYLANFQLVTYVISRFTLGKQTGRVDPAELTRGRVDSGAELVPGRVDPLPL